MNYFERYELIEDKDGYIVKLFLNRHLNEFSFDFLSNQRNYIKTENYSSLQESALRYISDKLHGVKVKTAIIIIGTMIIASIPLLDSSSAITEHNYEASLPVSTPVMSTKNQDNIGTDEVMISDIEIPQSEEQEKSVTDSQTIYVVKAGDTLYGISKVFHISVGELKSSNQLKSDTIYIGQKLFITGGNDSTINNSSDGTKQNQPISSSEENEKYSSILILVNKQSTLPIDYVPKDLIIPDVAFKAGSSEVKYMRNEAADALEALFQSAKKDNVTLYAVSGYRSYNRQEAIFASSVKRHGSEADANQYSAKAGQSEHQTGLAMDITSATVGYGLSASFGKTIEGQWVRENAYKYGFIIRYPKGSETITGYQYEPWHLRYVGVEAATIITNQNITLEEYLTSE